MSSKIVWVLNLSPDSFSDGKDYTLNELGNQIQKLIDDGVDIIDVGAESTAPGSSPISTEEELGRLKNFFAIISYFREKGIVFSLDTKKSKIAQIGIDAGIKIINDVSGGRYDPYMVDVIAKNRNISYIIMYCKNEYWHADLEPEKNPWDIFTTVTHFFDTTLPYMVSRGVHQEQIILDPGMGSFVSTDENDSIRILYLLPELKKRYQLPILVGTSRKWFLGKISPDKGPNDRIASSLVSSIYALDRWADYVRVHDVYEMRQAITVWNYLHF